MLVSSTNNRFSKAAFSVVLYIFIQLFSFSAFSQSTTFKSGSAIIDMGAATPTVANSLKPYGLIYALLSNYNVPVNGVISQTKVKDGIDFIYGTKSYRGGTYVISSDFLTPEVKTLISSWVTQGVVVDYTTSDITLNVTYKIAFAPKWVMDKTNGTIAVAYLTAAGIPATAYSFKNPSELAGCDDIFVMPHADPTWALHSNLYTWNKDYRGAIMASCHSVSVIESLNGAINGQNVQMNFLTTTGAVNYSLHTGAVTPFLHQFPSDPVAQYLGTTDAAQLKGSETVFLPLKGGAWRPGTKMLTVSPTQANIPTLSDGPAAINIYGRAFDDPTRGYVFYQAGHTVGGTAAANIAGQRMFFNFSFMALGDKAQNSFTVSLGNTVPSQVRGTVTYTGLTATVSSGTSTYTYQWKSSVPGTFTAPTSSVTNFIPADVSNSTQAVITCIVTDAACSRSAFDSKGTVVVPSRPALNAIPLTYTVTSDCDNNAFTLNLLSEVTDADAGTRTISVTNSPSSGTVSVNATSGIITYTPAKDYNGSVVLNYTISNGGISSNASSTITFNVGNYALAPTLTNDTYSSVLEDQVTVLNVLTNDKNNPTATSNNKLYIKDILTKPANGYVYINTDGTVSYLTKKNGFASSTSDSFTYEACNSDAGYCSVATVTVNVVDCGCASGTYKTGISTGGNSGTVTLTATADAYLDKSSSTSNFGSSSTTALRLSGRSSSTREVLYKFDVSSIPSGTTINSAYLNTYLTTSADLSSTSSNPFPSTIYPLKRDWVESSVTWSKFNSSTSWSTAGALGSGSDFVAITSVPSFNYTGTSSTTPAGTLIRSDISGIVSGWVNGTYSNYGLIIFPKSTSSSSPVYLGTRDNSTSAYRPTLVVNYGTSGTTYTCISIPTTYKPVVYADYLTTPSNTNLTITPLTNDVNYYSNSQSITSVTQPAYGTVTRSNNTLTYTPNGSYVGMVSFTYTVTDAVNAQTSTATVRINVTQIAPSVNADAATTPSGTPVTINVGANDVDNQGLMTAPVITVNPAFGTAIVSGTSVIYTPSAGYVGADTFKYSRNGASSSACSAVLSDDALVTLTMTNRNPIAVGDAITTVSCKPVTMDLLANDSDPEGTPLTISIVTNPAHGTIAVNSIGEYVYTSNSNYVGSDSFTYKVIDGSADQLVSNTVTVNITVGSAGINNAPVVVNDADKTIINQAVFTDVIANDSDPDNDAITINASGLVQPAHGTVELLGNGQLKYTPALNFVGTDSYQYQICDNNVSCVGSGTGLCSVGTVTITVTAIPIVISGTIWNDKDKSANNTFSNIRTNSEPGSNAYNGLYTHLIDVGNQVIDEIPVAYDGTYSFSSAPSLTNGLKISLNNQLVALGATLTTGSLPSTFTNTTPLISDTFTSTAVTMTGYDFGINELPTSVSYNYPEQANAASPVPFTIATSRFTGTDVDGTLVSVHLTSFPTNTSSISVNGTTYTAASGVWSNGGLTFNVSGFTSFTLTPNVGTVIPVISYKMVDNAGFESSSNASITIPYYIPLSAGSVALSGSAIFCGSGVPPQITSVDASGGRGTINYQWEISTTSSSSGFSDKVGATNASYTPTLAVTTTTYYRRRAYTTIDAAVYSNVLTVTVNSAPTVDATTPGLRSGTGTVTIDATGSTGATIDWYAAISGGSALQSGTLTGTINYTTPSISTSTIYYAQARDLVTGCLSDRTPVLAEVQGTLNAGVIGDDEAICGPGIPSLLTSTVDATAGTNTVTYQWQISTGGSYANISGATDLTYQSPSISATSSFKRIATATISGTATSSSSNIVTVTINPLPADPIAVNKARTGFGIVDHIATNAITGTTIDWYDEIGGALLQSGSNEFTTPYLTSTNDYFAVARNLTTRCVSNPVTVTAYINPVFDAGQINQPAAICVNQTPTAITSSSLATGGTKDITGGNGGAYTYQWQYSLDNITFNDIASANDGTRYQPSALSATTYYRRKVSTPNDPAQYSNVITVNVNALPTINTLSTSSVCLGSSVTLTTSGALTYAWSPSTGLSSITSASPVATPTTTTTYTVTGTDANGCVSTATATVTVNAIPTVSVSPTSATIITGNSVVLTAAGTSNYAWTPITGLSASNTISVTATPTATTTYTVRGTDATSNCSATASVTVTVNPVFTAGAISAAQTICVGATPATLTSSTAANGGIGTITYSWQYSTDGTTFTTISGATSSTYSPGALSVNTYYKRGATTVNDGTLYTSAILITVQESVGGSIVGSATVCAGTNSTVLTLSGQTGSVTKWQSALASDFSGTLTDISNTTASLTVTNLSVTKYYRAVVTQGSCVAASSATATITVNAVPSVSISPRPVTIVSGSSVTLTASGATSYSWTPVTGLSSSNTVSITATPSVTTTYTVVGTDANACSSSATVLVTVTSLAPADTDGDGVTDTQETADGTNPNDPCDFVLANQTITPTSAWLNADCDGDGTPNGIDTAPKDPCVHAAGATPVTTNAIWRAADCDGDGVTNGKESDDNTDPNDGCSYVAASKTLTPSTAWNALDCDGDGTPNGTDIAPKDPCVHAAGATPVTTNAIWRAADCDGDGVTNGKETDDNTDPNDGCSYVAASKTLTPSAAWNALDCDGDGTLNETDADPSDPCVHAAGATPVTTNAIWRAADCDGDGVTNGKESDDNTDPNDGCSYVATSKTLTPSTAWNALDCDGDGTPNGTDTDPKDPCVHAAGATPVTTNVIWRAADCDGDGVTNGKETDDNTDPKNGCDYNVASRTLTPSAAWGTLDCDADGNSNATDPHVDAPSASNDVVNVPNSGTATVNILTNDDFLPGANTTIERQASPNQGTANGTATFNGLTGELTYKRAPFEYGLKTLGYKVSNTGVSPAVSATAFVTIMACDLQDPLADCDGDGELNGTDLAPTDPCVYEPSRQVKANVSDDWKALDCDGDGVLNGTELLDGTSASDACSFKATSITLAPSAAWLALDCDADGITNKLEGTQDFDGDGIPNCLDSDSDGDSISDKLETTVDTDKDGKPDYLDLDSDNDGILDSVENKVCTGTGILCDTDADGIPNFRDLDSDADKINDVIEANGSDYNRDGIADGNIDEKGIPSSANKGLTPPDTDRDGKMDPYDVDSDGDGILDFDEEYNEDADFADCDKDGIINRLDPDECDIFSPQGISPNGDGKNDRLVFKGLFLRKIPNHLSIFNRWGTLVFEMESYDNSFTGSLLPDGTYYYILDFFGKKPTISNYLSVDRTIK